jgi:signal transduction histidine kinase
VDLGRPSLRLVVVLLIAALPPLAAFAVGSVVAGEWVQQNGYGTALLLGSGLTVVWIAIVAVLAGRVMADEARSLVELAQHGVATQSGGDGTRTGDSFTTAQRQLASALNERNRQIAELAAHVRAAPVSEDAPAVARSMVAAARSMTGDPTWTLAVLQPAGTDALAAGVYTTDDGVSSLDEVHGWASTLDLEASAGRGARHGIGPWGAFAVIDVVAGDELRAILLAPWEGRQPPSPAELDLFELLGQHAATAIDHALLYTRLRAQTDALNRMAALQTDFLRGVTHDLQTPLTSIGAAAAELGQASGLDDAAKADLDTIANQADRLRRMVGQLLAVSRLEAGALTPRQEVFRGEPIVRRTWAALRADRPLQLVDAGPAHLLVGDPDRLEQVLWAVLDNAVKYSPADSAVQITLSAQQDTDGLVGSIAVRDEGAGMDPETVLQAFEQFYRSDVARRLSPDGSGVGLYAARGLLRAMGGDISAESRLGAGTTMTVTLPAELATVGAEGLTTA